MSFTCSHNIMNFGPLAAEIGPIVWGSPANFNGFRVLAALLHDTPVLASAKLCGVEHKAPPTLGRAAITLGIGAHSSCLCCLLWYITINSWLIELSFGSVVFAQMTADCLYTLQWFACSPLKIALPILASVLRCWAHPSPERKWQLDCFSRFCRAH